jgi:hypothetical protein
MVEELNIMEHWLHDTDGGQPKYAQKNLSRFHFVDNQSNINWHGTELLSLR